MSENFSVSKKNISKMKDYLKSSGFYEMSRDKQLAVLYNVLNKRTSKIVASIE